MTIPANIAPLNFGIEEASHIKVVFSHAGEELKTLNGKSSLKIPRKLWTEWLHLYAGEELTVTVSAWTKDQPEGVVYKPFTISVSAHGIDPWIAYRLIEPGYELWNEMGIYQRDLTSFNEKVILTNKENHDGCINCHSFHHYSPENMMFHARGKNGTTVLMENNNLRRVDLAELGPKKPGTYPVWHPSGNYIAFSSNETHQSFYHFGQTPTEVYDLSSDLIVYDIKKDEVLSDPRFTEESQFETFPAFSPDGKYLYFCRAEAREMPFAYKSLKYALCRVAFDEANGTLGERVDTLYHPADKGGSVSFPRISPDGQYLLYTEANCATFPIWHKEADLKMIRLSDGEEIDTAVINSEDTESYHSWSSNGKWIIFSSRRIDGRYTRLYIAAVTEAGGLGKPFLLPQKDPEENALRMRSYNIPEFVKGEVRLDRREVASLFD
ncbi:hypothetical protein [Parabacteroides sp. PF5-6]|uniref:TolB family protein n=1 Tax=Parabacteroides sp. PF5-6 TaxID=1742403 RepID=UPI0024072FC3|nr:hypothetical protein [Parabacteroides sp. PF5-6]